MSDDTTGPDPGAARLALRLSPVQETLVIPLYGRAVESAKPRGVLRDQKAVQIVDRIDYDFTTFDGGPSLLGSVLRTCILDAWTRDFLAAHPDGTVVELGAGLSSRFDRLDNGTCHWFDLDQPEVVDLRRLFFDDTSRRRTLAASIQDPSWMDTVNLATQPFLFIAEGVLTYLSQDDVHRVLSGIARRFPGGLLALDTCGRRMLDTQDRHDSLRSMVARMSWACNTPQQLQQLGLRLRQSRTLAQTPRAVRTRLSHPQRFLLTAAAVLNLRDFARYRVNLFEATQTLGSRFLAT